MHILAICVPTVRSHRDQEIYFEIARSSNYREVEIKICYPKNNLFTGFFLSKISFGCAKETSQGDVNFTHPKKYVIIASYLY